MRRQPEFCAPTTTAPWPRAALAVLAVVGTAIAAALSQTPTTARADTPLTVAISGEDALDRARTALAEPNLAAADALLRAAWSDPATRDAAAQQLWQLHRRLDFTLRADEPGVEKTHALLGKRFKRFDTPHFVVLSDADAAWVRERSMAAEHARTQFYRVMTKLDLPVVPHAARLVIVIFNDAAAYRAFARQHDHVDAAWVAGYFASGANRVVIFNQASAEDARAAADVVARRGSAAINSLRAATDSISETKLIHETIHLLAFNSGLQRPDRPAPFWLSEGLATSFESTAPTQPFGPDRPRSLIPDRLDRLATLLAERTTTPPNDLAALITRSDAGSADELTADAMYGLSHALFMHVMKRQPEQLAAFFRALSDRPAEETTPTHFAALFNEHFGNPAAIERSIRRATLARLQQDRPTADAGEDR